jgi:CDP-diacylglycerol--glycerol-3-phosphate 3-phosphatidyltransferase
VKTPPIFTGTTGTEPRRRPSLREQALSLPNLLTLFRVAAIPVVLVLLQRGSPRASFLAALVYIAAAITDYLDGWVARRRQLTSTLGKFLDPLADKLLVMAVLVLMIPMGRVPAWLTIVILGREIAITGLRGVASAEGFVIQASRGGKWKTALQMIALIGLILHYPYDIDFLFFDARINFQQVGFWTLIVSLAPSLLSALDYVLGFARASDTPASGPA